MAYGAPPTVASSWSSLSLVEPASVDGSRRRSVPRGSLPVAPKSSSSSKTTRSNSNSRTEKERAYQTFGLFGRGGVALPVLPILFRHHPSQHYNHHPRHCSIWPLVLRAIVPKLPRPRDGRVKRLHPVQFLWLPCCNSYSCRAAFLTDIVATFAVLLFCKLLTPLPCCCYCRNCYLLTAKTKFCH